MEEQHLEQNFGLIRCTYSINPQPRLNGPMHTHDVIELYYLISGNCTYLIEGTEYDLKPGDIVIKRPFEAHKLIVNSASIPYERIGISVSSDYFSALDPDGSILRRTMERPLGVSNRFSASDFGHSLCADCFELIRSEFSTLDRMTLASRTLFLLTEINHAMKNMAEVSRSTMTGARLVDYVNHHLFSDLTLERISREFYLSQSQINRIFRQNTGSSLGKYVAVKRLITARNLIRSGVCATKACSECGYSDYSVFYRAYRQQFGHPPKTDAPKHETE